MTAARNFVKLDHNSMVVAKVGVGLSKQSEEDLSRLTSSQRASSGESLNRTLLFDVR